MPLNLYNKHKLLYVFICGLFHNVVLYYHSDNVFVYHLNNIIFYSCSVSGNDFLHFCLG